MQVSIVFHSGFGHTAKSRRVHSPAQGVSGVADAQVNLVSVADGDVPWDVLEASNAIIFGSPTYNGLVSAKFKQFMEDATKAAWFEKRWCNKIAAGFTNSGAQHGDKLNP